MKPMERGDGIGGQLSLWSIAALGILLAVPAFALHRRGIDLRLCAGYAVSVSMVTYFIYAVDKRRARDGVWRVPEKVLHLADLLGGWPGGFLAQRWLRHKCSKASFQFTFSLIVVTHQFAALDSLQDWSISRRVLHYFERNAGNAERRSLNNFF